ncbi:MAG: type I 3-dehydroquinate dehydratase [Patescibacteria group bacterium]|nr:type I 3-dehydroquinate dehydratase [Patescibacteria group bacterium]
MKRQLNELLEMANIVGVIASKEDARVAIANPDIADIFEWRVDCEPHIRAEIRELCGSHSRPVIITVRDASEGGRQSDWNADTRMALYREHMPLATFIDVEASTADIMIDVIREAKSLGVGIIISQHAMNGPWSPSMSYVIARKAKLLGCDIFKLAIVPDSFEEFAEFVLCASNIMSDHKLIVAPMAMGDSFGKVSRLLFAKAGAVLMYTSLAQSVVRGQWNASEIRQMVAKC